MALILSAPVPRCARPVWQGGAGGVPVLFVHGLARNRAAWAAHVAHLRPGRRAIAIDLHGFCESARSAEMMDDAAAVKHGARRLPRLVE